MKTPEKYFVFSPARMEAFHCLYKVSSFCERCGAPLPEDAMRRLLEYVLSVPESDLANVLEEFAEKIKIDEAQAMFRYLARICEKLGILLTPEHPLS